MRCAVALCKTNNECKTFNKGIRFFRFPNDLNVQKIWINACQRKEKFNIKYARVCSKHFSEDNYQRDLRYELCGDLYSSKNQRVLKTGAIPSLNLPNTNTTDDDVKTKQRKERLVKTNQSKLVEEILLHNSHKCLDSRNGGRSSINITKTVEWVNLESSEENSPCPRSSEIGTETDTNDRDNTISKLKQEIEHPKNENKAFENIFAPNQRKFKSPKKRATWKMEDIVKAIVIHSAGARAYRLLLKVYSLPAESTLTAWRKKIELEPGILKPVLHIIKQTDLI